MLRLRSGKDVLCLLIKINEKITYMRPTRSIWYILISAWNWKTFIMVLILYVAILAQHSSLHIALQRTSKIVLRSILILKLERDKAVNTLTHTKNIELSAVIVAKWVMYLRIVIRKRVTRRTNKT